MQLKFVEQTFEKLILSFKMYFFRLVYPQCSSSEYLWGWFFFFVFFCTEADGRAAEYSHRSLYQLCSEETARD